MWDLQDLGLRPEEGQHRVDLHRSLAMVPSGPVALNSQIKKNSISIKQEIKLQHNNF